MADNNIEEKTVFGEIEEIQDVVDKKFKQFKNFDRYDKHSPYDHHFFYNRTSMFDFIRASLARRIEKEWEILKQNLPSSIFVRGYGRRIDLMRVAITGLEGTPYCHGLFFFDIFFPTNYPSKPPEIFHRSYGLELNVPCLSTRDLDRKDYSLVNNFINVKQLFFNNSSSQKYWNPKDSDILQLLVSIQQQVLNSAKRDTLSNKEVFMRNCESMIRTLKCPPKGFVDLVKGHFRKSAHSILLIYKAQMKIYNNCEDMKELFFKLLKTFEANGAYCRHHCDERLLKALKEEEYSDEQQHQFAEEKDQDYYWRYRINLL